MYPAHGRRQPGCAAKIGPQDGNHEDDHQDSKDIDRFHVVNFPSEQGVLSDRGQQRRRCRPTRWVKYRGAYGEFVVGGC